MENSTAASQMATTVSQTPSLTAERREPKEMCTNVSVYISAGLIVALIFQRFGIYSLGPLPGGGCVIS